MLPFQPKGRMCSARGPGGTSSSFSNLSLPRVWKRGTTSSHWPVCCCRLFACCSYIDVVAEALCKDLTVEVRLPLAGVGRLNLHLRRRSLNLKAACALLVMRHPIPFASLQGVQVPPAPACQVLFCTRFAELHHFIALSAGLLQNVDAAAVDVVAEVQCAHG